MVAVAPSHHPDPRRSRCSRPTKSQFAAGWASKHFDLHRFKIFKSCNFRSFYIDVTSLRRAFGPAVKLSPRRFSHSPFATSGSMKIPTPRVQTSQKKPKHPKPTNLQCEAPQWCLLVNKSPSNYSYVRTINHSSRYMGGSMGVPLVIICYHPFEIWIFQ